MNEPSENKLLSLLVDVITDVIALLGRGAFLSAPFRNSISSACLPTMRSSAAIFASYS